MFHTSYTCLRSTKLALLTECERREHVNQERHRRRVTRILQVREQSREISRQVVAKTKDEDKRETRRKEFEERCYAGRNSSREENTDEHDLHDVAAHQNRITEELQEWERKAREDSAKAHQRYRRAIRIRRKAEKLEKQSEQEKLERKRRAAELANQRSLRIRDDSPSKGTPRMINPHDQNVSQFRGSPRSPRRDLFLEQCHNQSLEEVQ